MFVCDGMVTLPRENILPTPGLFTGAELLPVTGPVAAESEFEKALPNAPITPLVFDLVDTSTDRIATPTIAVRMVTTASVIVFMASS